MSKVLISLTPTGKFFFGGDISFSVNNKDNNGYSSYIIESNKFPQQTSLLGMLRYLVLSHDSLAFDNKVLKIKSRGHAATLIGETSFKMNDEGHKNDFGVIHSLSNVFLQVNESGKWIDLNVAPIDYSYKTVSFAANKEADINGCKVEIPEITEYSAKERPARMYVTADGVTYKESEIFKTDQRIGIDRDVRTGKTKEDALYKQVNYRMNDDDRKFRFAFYADIEQDESVLMGYDRTLVSVGGDSSCFLLNIVLADSLSSPTYYPNDYDMQHKVVLLSPAYIKAEALTLARFGMTETMSFRFLKTTLDTSCYNRLSGKIQPSEKIDLYQPGSVFYFKDDVSKNKFVEALTSKSEFRQIGYNQYHIQK